MLNIERSKVQKHCAFEMLGTVHLMTMHHIPEEQNYYSQYFLRFPKMTAAICVKEIGLVYQCKLSLSEVYGIVLCFLLS